MFKFWLFLARYGFFFYEGGNWRAPKHYPRARVKYNTGEMSCVMPIGNAVSLANIFGGEVIPANTTN